MTPVRCSPMKTFAAIWIASSLALLAGAANAAECRDLHFEDISFTVCEADPASEQIRLFHSDPDGKLFGTFDNAEASLNGGAFAWAMNAGMYHPDRRPVGLYIEDGREVAGIVTREGPGNFGLLPNGVLCLNDTSAQVIESRQFKAEGTACRYATQSGPMLVIGGKLHSRFLPNSDSTNIRNGVGVTADGTLIAAISNQPVNFHRFARLFRDVLKTPNALFMDGNISRLYGPGLKRHDIGFPMGPILGVVE